MKKLLFGTLFILSCCASLYKMIGRGGIIISLFGFMFFWWLCLYVYCTYINKRTKQEEQRERKAVHGLDITEWYYHQDIWAN